MGTWMEAFPSPLFALESYLRASLPFERPQRRLLCRRKKIGKCCHCVLPLIMQFLLYNDLFLVDMDWVGEMINELMAAAWGSFTSLWPISISESEGKIPTLGQRANSENKPIRLLHYRSNIRLVVDRDLSSSAIHILLTNLAWGRPYWEKISLVCTTSLRSVCTVKRPTFSQYGPRANTSAININTIIHHTDPSLPNISDSIVWAERDSARLKMSS